MSELYRHLLNRRIVNNILVLEVRFRNSDSRESFIDSFEKENDPLSTNDREILGLVYDQKGKDSSSNNVLSSSNVYTDPNEYYLTKESSKEIIKDEEKIQKEKDPEARMKARRKANGLSDTLHTGGTDDMLRSGATEYTLEALTSSRPITEADRNHYPTSFFLKRIGAFDLLNYGFVAEVHKSNKDGNTPVHVLALPESMILEGNSEVTRLENATDRLFMAIEVKDKLSRNLSDKYKNSLIEINGKKYALIGTLGTTRVAKNNNNQASQYVSRMTEKVYSLDREAPATILNTEESESLTLDKIMYGRQLKSIDENGNESMTTLNKDWFMGNPFLIRIWIYDGVSAHTYHRPFQSGPSVGSNEMVGLSKEPAPGASYIYLMKADGMYYPHAFSVMSTSDVDMNSPVMLHLKEIMNRILKADGKYDKIKAYSELRRYLVIPDGFMDIRGDKVLIGGESISRDSGLDVAEEIVKALHNNSPVRFNIPFESLEGGYVDDNSQLGRYLNSGVMKIDISTPFNVDSTVLVSMNGVTDGSLHVNPGASQKIETDTHDVHGNHEYPLTVTINKNKDGSHETNTYKILYEVEGDESVSIIGIKRDGEDLGKDSIEYKMVRAAFLFGSRKAGLDRKEDGVIQFNLDLPLSTNENEFDAYWIEGSNTVVYGKDKLNDYRTTKGLNDTLDELNSFGDPNKKPRPQNPTKEKNDDGDGDNNDQPRSKGNLDGDSPWNDSPIKWVMEKLVSDESSYDGHSEVKSAISDLLNHMEGKNMTDLVSYVGSTSKSPSGSSISPKEALNIAISYMIASREDTNLKVDTVYFFENTIHSEEDPFF